MSIKMPALPYIFGALEPHISAATLKLHYGKHHKHYVEKLNALIAGTHYDQMTLEEIIIATANHEGADRDIYNNAAQAWNHDFYWHCLSPEGGQDLVSEFHTVITENFGTLNGLQTEMKDQASKCFGSGWVWLVKNDLNALSVITTANAGNPMIDGKTPLIACDVWEHAYYLDYKNEREKYFDQFWNVIDWDFVENQYTKVKAGYRRIQRPQPERVIHH